jgi:hypothetical protein
LDPTPLFLRLKLLHACDQWHSSRASIPLTVATITCAITLKVTFDQPIALTINSCCHCTDDVTTLKVTFDQPHNTNHQLVPLH